MPIDTILLLGAGGHSKVVLDALLASAKPGEIILSDDNPARKSQSVINHLIVPTPNLDELGYLCHICIGDNTTRASIAKTLLEKNQKLFTIKHPSTVVSTTATVQTGCFLAAKSIVGPDATIGTCTIINHGAIVDHDCRVGAYCHIAPNATLGGNVSIADRCFIGAAATILPGIQIGSDVIVGAGAVVTKDIPAHTTVVGIPAKNREDNERA